jgi:hypothetical protein
LTRPQWLGAREHSFKGGHEGYAEAQPKQEI